MWTFYEKLTKNYSTKKVNLGKMKKSSANLFIPHFKILKIRLNESRTDAQTWSNVSQRDIFVLFDVNLYFFCVFETKSCKHYKVSCSKG